jgi:hypothetical protein
MRPVRAVGFRMGQISWWEGLFSPAIACGHATTTLVQPTSGWGVIQDETLRAGRSVGYKYRMPTIRSSGMDSRLRK